MFNKKDFIDLGLMVSGSLFGVALAYFVLPWTGIELFDIQQPNFMAVMAVSVVSGYVVRFSAWAIYLAMKGSRKERFIK